MLIWQWQAHCGCNRTQLVYKLCMRQLGVERPLPAKWLFTAQKERHKWNQSFNTSEPDRYKIEAWVCARNRLAMRKQHLWTKMDAHLTPASSLAVAQWASQLSNHTSHHRRKKHLCLEGLEVQEAYHISAMGWIQLRTFAASHPSSPLTDNISCTWLCQNYLKM